MLLKLKQGSGSGQEQFYQMVTLLAFISASNEYLQLISNYMTNVKVSDEENEEKRSIYQHVKEQTRELL